MPRPNLAVTWLYVVTGGEGDSATGDFGEAVARARCEADALGRPVWVAAAKRVGGKPTGDMRDVFLVRPTKEVLGR
jgi:hypothetical protein